MHEHSCWQCGTEEAGSLFCRYCNSLQRPTPDYYEFFGLPKHLSIEQDDLKNRFYALSRRLHPDLYTRKSEAERSFSLEATAILNDGFRVLKDPFQRAEYVLRENGFDIGEQRSKDVPAELLEEVFELNMALDELRDGDESVLPQLEKSRGHFVTLLEEIDGELIDQFRRHDALTSQEHRLAVLSGIRGVLNRRRYIRNLVNEVDRELSRRNA
jgi:molecular chaperone HscB